MLENPTLDLFKYSAFPELAVALCARRETILNRWQEVVRQKLDGLDEMTLEQLRDDLPDVLQVLAKALESDDGSSMADLREASETHGEVRFHQSFNINELLVEYGLLRPILVDEVMSQLGRTITPEELAALNMGIDTAVRRSVLRFIADQQKKLRVVTDAQTKYLSFLSHDLRGGLNGVLLMAEVLKRELAAEPRFAESLEDLDSMRRSILETVATMDRFLHAEQFRQGKIQPHNTTVDVRQVLGDMSTQFAYQARNKGLELKFEITDGSQAFTDKELLALILQNLISNAIKYTPKGQVRVLVEPHDGVRISVIDQGPGISADQLPKLFEHYHRGETHGQPGVGLGLSIAHQAAEMIGAKLKAESTLGHGATFRLEIPAA